MGNFAAYSDLKVVVLLLGFSLSFTKYNCFFCEWDSRDRILHYVEKQWSSHQAFTLRQKYLIQTTLVDPEKVILPLLHIKLGLMKNFVKAIDKEGCGFSHLKPMFSSLTISEKKVQRKRIQWTSNKYCIVR